MLKHQELLLPTLNLMICFSKWLKTSKISLTLLREKTFNKIRIWIWFYNKSLRMSGPESYLFLKILIFFKLILTIFKTHLESVAKMKIFCIVVRVLPSSPGAIGQLNIPERTTNGMWPRSLYLKLWWLVAKYSKPAVSFIIIIGQSQRSWRLEKP